MGGSIEYSKRAPVPVALAIYDQAPRLLTNEHAEHSLFRFLFIPLVVHSSLRAFFISPLINTFMFMFTVHYAHVPAANILIEGRRLIEHCASHVCAMRVL